MSFLLISVLLPPDDSGAEVETTTMVGAAVRAVAPAGSVAAAWDFLKKLNFMVEDEARRHLRHTTGGQRRVPSVGGSSGPAVPSLLVITFRKVTSVTKV